MACEVIVDNINREDWERYAGNFADYSIYQTWPYQQVRAEMDGQEVSRVVIKDENGHVVTMCQIRIKHVKLLGLRIGYVQRGPLFRGKDSKIICSTEALKKLREAYLGHKVNVLRVVPNARNDEVGRIFAKMLEASGFPCLPSVAPYRTIILPLDGAKEDIRKGFHKEWRRILRKAEKVGIKIREDSSDKSFAVLEKLYLEAKSRKGFKGVNPQEFARPQWLLSANERMHVVVAYYDGDPVSAHAANHLGDSAVPVLNASNEKGLACGSSYLVFWKALLSAKRAGMKRYDLGGTDPEKNPKGYLFKKRMGGEETFYIGTFEVCSNLRVKTTWRMAEKIYSALKR